MTNIVKRLKELGWKKHNGSYEFQNGGRYVQYDKELKIIDVFEYSYGTKYGAQLTYEEFKLFAKFIEGELE